MMRWVRYRSVRARDMVFILSADGRDEDVVRSFERYRAHLNSAQAAFPTSAFKLGISDWYFDPQDHRSPHDAWVERIAFTEHASGDRGEKRRLSLKVRLLGAYHDGYIELEYPKVYSYAIGSVDAHRGHGDWRYDEFRVSDTGNLIHEIEWSNGRCGWKIEASDMAFTWIVKP
jgi:hypothetical protein